MNISTIPGMTQVIAASLATVNVTDQAALAKLTDDQLLVIPGLSPQRLARIRAQIGYGAGEQSEQPADEADDETEEETDDETEEETEGVAEETRPAVEIEREFVKFEWPNYPGGTMLLHEGLGYPGEIDVHFFGGFHITDDPDVVAALRERGKKFRDVFEVPLGATERMHGRTSGKAPPPIPTA